MAITFYYGSGSPYAWRVHLALEHKALPYDRKILSFAAGDTRKPEFVALRIERDCRISRRGLSGPRSTAASR